jgi:predicted ATPase
VTLLDQAIQIVGQESGNVLLSELCRTKAELLREVSPENRIPAESLFQQALQIARAGHAHMLELRVSVSLNRLWREQGKSEEGRRLLSGVYDKFTEGFSTPDLDQAKALLDS